MMFRYRVSRIPELLPTKHTFHPCFTSAQPIAIRNCGCPIRRRPPGLHAARVHRSSFEVRRRHRSTPNRAIRRSAAFPTTRAAASRRLNLPQKCAWRFGKSPRHVSLLRQAFSVSRQSSNGARLATACDETRRSEIHSSRFCYAFSEFSQARRLPPRPAFSTQTHRAAVDRYK